VISLTCDCRSERMPRPAARSRIGHLPPIEEGGSGDGDDGDGDGDGHDDDDDS